LALSLAAAAVAGAVGYGCQSQPPSNQAQAPRSAAETTQAHPTSSVVVPGALKEAAATSDEQSQNAPVLEPSTRRLTPADEAAQRERTRKSALDDVRIGYTLLLEDLDLPEPDKKDLIALLVDMQVERVWTSYQRGRTISAQERSDRISAVIGPEKLEQFLALEENAQAYWDTYQIALMLQRRGLPTTETQRDAVFAILVDVRAQYPSTSPSPELDRTSEEWIEHVLRQHDEHDRHVIELAPTALSPNQVVRLFEQYQSMSRQRVASVEVFRKLKAEHPDRFRGWGYTPGSWN
jgi:hypothetical protein